MEVIETLPELEANLRQLEEYLTSANPEEWEFARSLIRRGLCFVVTHRGERAFFGPSRFVGYKQNSLASHDANDEKHGRETNRAISALLEREPVEDEGMESEYHLFCERFGIELMNNRRKYWLSD